MTAIHELNPHHQMALMTAAPEEREGFCRRLCATSRCSGSTSGWSKCCDCCGRPCCRCDLDWNLIGAPLQPEHWANPKNPMHSC